MRHADVTGLGGMAEDMVTSLHIPQLPAVGFEHLDDLLAVHGGYYNHLKRIINTITTITTNKKKHPRTQDTKSLNAGSVCAF